MSDSLENFILRYRAEVGSKLKGDISNVLMVRKEQDTINVYHNKKAYKPTYSTVQRQLRKVIKLSNKGD